MQSIKQLLFSSSRSTITSILILLIIFVAIPFIIRVAKKQQETSQYSTTGKTSPLEKERQALVSSSAHTTLTISPNPLVLETNSTTLLNVNIQTNEDSVTAVQLELAYDPKAVTNVDIIPGTFFAKPSILYKQIDTTKGRISLALGIQPTDEPVNGSGIVANISFVPLANNQSTEITFLPKTLVTSFGAQESTLKSSKGTTIILP